MGFIWTKWRLSCLDLDSFSVSILTIRRHFKDKNVYIQHWTFLSVKTSVQFLLPLCFQVKGQDEGFERVKIIFLYIYTLQLLVLSTSQLPSSPHTLQAFFKCQKWKLGVGGRGEESKWTAFLNRWRIGVRALGWGWNQTFCILLFFNF